MDFRLRIVTDGTLLSSRTLWSVVNSLNSDFEKAIYRVLREEFPLASRTRLEKHVSGKVNFVFEDIRRGSWELIVIGGIGGIIGKAMYDLAMDFIKGSDAWKDFKRDLEKRISSPSRKIAMELEKEIVQDKRLGPLIIERRSIAVEQLSNGFTRITGEIYLRRGNNRDLLVTSEQQVEALLEDIEVQRLKR